eukprot:NODE_45_length_32908_cov_0.790271.p32 type:complete len:109 gc:universal NODE_45_length_32908_cov_0.790271:17165-17491(+)
MNPSVYFIYLESILIRRVFFKTTSDVVYHSDSIKSSKTSTQIIQTTLANSFFKPVYKLNDFINLSVFAIVKMILNSLLIIALPYCTRFERSKITKISTSYFSANKSIS